MELCEAYSLIESYKCLKRYCTAIDEYVLNAALNFSPNPSEYSTKYISDKIIDLVNRKKKFVNLKVFVDECMDKLPENLKKMLCLKAEYNCSIANACDILKISERTAFRHLKRAEEEFLNVACAHKDCEQMSKIINSEFWLYSKKQDYFAINEQIKP